MGCARHTFCTKTGHCPRRLYNGPAYLYTTFIYAVNRNTSASRRHVAIELQYKYTRRKQMHIKCAQSKPCTYIYERYQSTYIHINNNVYHIRYYKVFAVRMYHTPLVIHDLMGTTKIFLSISIY